MRLFVGLDLPQEVIERLTGLIERLRPAAPIAWSPPANLHITTKFIGHWPDERLEEMKAALTTVTGPPVQVHIGGLGFFPNARSPRVFWCGVEAPTLADLAARTEWATARLGVESEKRPYSPHLTLARIRPRNVDWLFYGKITDLRRLHEEVAALGAADLASFEARSFFLYLSQMSRGGSVYTKLAEFPLAQ